MSVYINIKLSNDGVATITLADDSGEDTVVIDKNENIAHAAVVAVALDNILGVVETKLLAEQFGIFGPEDFDDDFEGAIV